MPKPAFDQSKPFEKVAQVKPDFDPSKPFDTAKDSAPRTIDAKGIAKTFGNAAANAATLGYLPQISAALEPAIAKGYDIIHGTDVSKNYPSYTDLRDYASARLAKEKEEHPIAAGAGMVAGAIGSGGLLVRALPAINATSKLGKIGQAAESGAILGAATNPGDVAGMLDPIQLDQRAANALMGGALGAGAQGAIQAVRPVKDALKFVGTKISSTLTGVPEQEIKTYASRAAEINRMFKESGGELSVAADKIRQETQDAIRAARQRLSNDVAQTIAASPKKPAIDAKPVIAFLESAKSKLDPIFHEGDIKQLSGIIAKVKEGTVPESFGKKAGLTNAKYLHLIKEYLQGRAAQTYMENGQIFQMGSRAAQAAKGGAALARKLVNAAEPGVAKANNQLSALHTIESSLNKNLIAPGKPDSALFAAGAGTNQRNEKMLEALQGLTGYPLLARARGLSSARTFGKPSLLPTDYTGKAVARQVGAGLLGGAVAGPIGAGMGAAMASPAALKLAINAGNMVGGLPSAVALAERNPVALRALMTRGLIAPGAEEFSVGPSQPPMLIDVGTKGQRSPAKKESAIQRRLREKQQ